jgi:hypothetical protein
VSDELKAIAVATLQAVCEDASAPAAARAAASRTLLELTGAIGRLQTPESGSDKPLVEMSAGDLDSEIQRLATLVNGSGKRVRTRKRSGSGPEPASYELI